MQLGLYRHRPDVSLTSVDYCIVWKSRSLVHKTGGWWVDIDCMNETDIHAALTHEYTGWDATETSIVTGDTQFLIPLLILKGDLT